VHPAFQPDFTFYFDLTPEVGRAGLEASRAPDRFESEREAFHARVRAAYLRRASEDPQRFHVIDAGRSIGAIQAELHAIVARLGQ
jgi:dTMP kinase